MINLTKHTFSDLPDKKCIIGPANGWKYETFYLVEVSYFKGNPIHQAIFFSGNKGTDKELGPYNVIFNPYYEEKFSIEDVYYLKCLGELTIND